MNLKLQPSDLESAYADEIAVKALQAIAEVILTGDTESMLAAVEKLPESWKTLYYADSLDSKVQNAGFSGYFDDRGVDHLEEVIRAVEQVGDRSVIDIVKRAEKIFREVDEIELRLYPMEFRDEPSEVPRFPGWEVMASQAEELRNQLESLDDEYYDLEPGMLTCIGQYILANREKFL